MPAGIPLDGRGIRYGDQERPDGGFEDLKSIEFDFECEDRMRTFSFLLPFLSRLLCALNFQNIGSTSYCLPSSHFFPLFLFNLHTFLRNLVLKNEIFPHRRHGIHRPLQRIRRGLAPALRPRRLLPRAAAEPAHLRQLPDNVHRRRRRRQQQRVAENAFVVKMGSFFLVSSLLYFEGDILGGGIFGHFFGEQWWVERGSLLASVVLVRGALVLLVPWFLVRGSNDGA